VLVTGGWGRCGTAILDHLGDGDYEFTCFDSAEPPDDREDDADAVVGDVADYDALRSACEGMDAIVHLAAYRDTDGDWSDVFEPNLLGTYNALEAAREAGVETFVFGSTNHVMGLYEREHAPDLYERGYGLVLDHEDPVRPDSLYGASKSFGEDLGRHYAETGGAPDQFYALRIATVNAPAYDHPYGDAEAGVDDGRWDRDGDQYDWWVDRMRATWQSRRDFAHQIECCLRDESVEFDAFYGVSDNRRRWFDLEHARAVLGYDPVDDAADWDAPPE